MFTPGSGIHACLLTSHVSVEDPLHSDSVLLRNMLVRTYMQDLKDVTQEMHYENYRAERIHKMTHMMQDKKRRWGGGWVTFDNHSFH